MMDQEHAERLFRSKSCKRLRKRLQLAGPEPSRRHQRRCRHCRGYADQRKWTAAAHRWKCRAVIGGFVASDVASPALGKAVLCRANIGVVIAGDDRDTLRR